MPKKGKIAFVRASMVVTYYIKLFRTEADRHNGILMSLLLLVAETISVKCSKCTNSFGEWFALSSFLFVSGQVFAVTITTEYINKMYLFVVSCEFQKIYFEKRSVVGFCLQNQFHRYTQDPDKHLS